MNPPARILYCHCAYAQVVPTEVKDEVLRQLAESGVAFDAVADLCELSAKRDPALKKLIEGVGTSETGGVELRLAACYPRAVKWLFHAAGIDFPTEGAEVLNMRTESAEQVVQMLLNGKATSEPAESKTD